MRDSAERFQALFERSLDGIYIHDFDGSFLDANPAALRLMGYQRADIASLKLSALLSEDQVARALESLSEFETTGKRTTASEFRVRRKDGTFVDIETRITQIPFEGTAGAILGIARDISQRKRKRRNRCGKAKSAFA